jgi:disulfide bond formation protein DsbB
MQTPTPPTPAPATPAVPAPAASRRAALLLAGAITVVATLLMLSPSLFLMLRPTPTLANAAEAAAAAAASAAPGLDAAAVSRGAEIYGSSCIACHGAGGVGVKGLGKDLVHSDFIRDKSDAQLVTFLKVGRDAGDPLNTTKIPMPPKGGNPALNDANLADLVAYMRSLQVSAQ